MAQNMLWQRHLGLAVVLAAHSTAFSATATTTRIDFEGLTPLVGDLRADVSVNEFYNGGSSTFKSNNAPAAQGPVPGPGV
ncbi:MAG: hypothetical protein KF800_20440, partial [Lysobacter sp.]|nr:hypothetical protein [Lysobacter sp.]